MKTGLQAQKDLNASQLTDVRCSGAVVQFDVRLSENVGLFHSVVVVYRRDLIFFSDQTTSECHKESVKRCTLSSLLTSLNYVAQGTRGVSRLSASTLREPARRQQLPAGSVLLRTGRSCDVPAAECENTPSLLRSRFHV